MLEILGDRMPALLNVTPEQTFKSELTFEDAVQLIKSFQFEIMYCTDSQLYLKAAHFKKEVLAQCLKGISTSHNLNQRTKIGAIKTICAAFKYVHGSFSTFLSFNRSAIVKKYGMGYIRTRLYFNAMAGVKKLNHLCLDMDLFSAQMHDKAFNENPAHYALHLYCLGGDINNNWRQKLKEYFGSDWKWLSKQSNAYIYRLIRNTKTINQIKRIIKLRPKDAWLRNKLFLQLTKEATQRNICSETMLAIMQKHIKNKASNWMPFPDKTIVENEAAIDHIYDFGKQAQIDITAKSFRALYEQATEFFNERRRQRMQAFELGIGIYGWRPLNGNVMDTYSSEKWFQYSIAVPDKFESENGRFRFTLLSSNYQLETEGKQMHHCVGSFSSEASKGKYIVYHIEDTQNKEGEDSRGYTVGFRHDYTNGWYMQQCYGLYNRTKPDSRIIVTFNLLTKYLNSFNVDCDVTLSIKGQPDIRVESFVEELIF